MPQLLLLWCLAVTRQSNAQGASLTVLASFNGTNGSDPWGALLEASDGNFYGTTMAGGDNPGSAPYSGPGYGTVFRLMPGGDLTSLASFEGTNGMSPTAGLVEAGDGNFYGVTWYGGVSNMGTVFQVSPSGQLTTQVSFVGTNGAWPRGGLVRGSDGAMYGSTRFGGASFFDPRAHSYFPSTPNGYGALFRITTNGHFTLLYSFTPDTEGVQPFNKLVSGQDGNLYGTSFGGAAGYGMIFRMTLAGTVTVLKSLDQTTGLPSVALSQGRDGTLLARTDNYNSNQTGTLIRMTTNGLIIQQVSLAPGPDHSPPQEVCEGSDGNLYGTMPVNAGPFGAIFRVTPGGNFSMIYSFDNTNGNFPYAPLIQARDGKFYGVTEGGGAFGNGAIYRLSIPSAAAPLMRAPIPSSDGLQLSWNSLPGRSYQLQFKSTLDQSAWSDSGGSITSTGTLVTAVDQTAPGSTGFFRVVMLP